MTKQYWAFAAAVETDEAKTLFKQKYGYLPRVVRTGGCVLCEISEPKANSIYKEGHNEPKELQELQYKLSI